MDRAPFPADIDQRLNALANAAPWYDGAGGLRVVDHVHVTALSRPLWLLLARDAGTRLYFFAVTQDELGALADAAPSPLYQRELLAWLAAHGSVATAAGRHIVYRGIAAAALADSRLVDGGHGASSNDVRRLDIGGLPAMHKLYRRPAIDNHEAEACLRLGRHAPSPLPRHIADYRYREHDGAEYPLGLLTEFVDGRGLHADLSVSLRTLWPLATAHGADPADLVAHHCAPLLPDLLRWQLFLEHCHQMMVQEFGPRAGDAAPRFALDDYCADARARLARLRPQIDADTLLTPAHASRIHALLDQLEKTCFGADHEQLAASACHGDLHLSHLLWRRDDGADVRKLIDMSPPAVDAADPAFRNGSVLLDWVALERALDYVCLDEAALALTSHGGPSQEDVMHGMLLAQLDASNSDTRANEPAASAIESATSANEPAASATVAPDIRQRCLLTARAHWHRTVAHALCGAGTTNAGRDRFYYGRLLQELEYNYGHRRPYYRCIDFHSLAQRLSHGA